MKRLLYFSAVFVLGALLGAAFTSLLIGHRVDELFLENRYLHDDLSVADKQIKKLQQSNKPLKSRVISKIKTNVEFDPKAEYTDFEKNNIKLDVERNVRVWLETLLGQNPDTMDCSLVPPIVDNRVLEADNHKLRLKVKLVVVSETIKVYLIVLPIQDSN